MFYNGAAMLSLRNFKTKLDMRHRPKRENYPRGVYGEIDYQERLERYCTYLENRNKELTEQCNIANVGNFVRQELERRVDLILSEPDGIVRETMIKNIPLDL